MKVHSIDISKKEFDLAAKLVIACAGNIVDKVDEDVGALAIIHSIRNAYALILSYTIVSMRDEKISKNKAIQAIKWIESSLNDLDITKMIDDVYAGRDFTV